MGPVRGSIVGLDGVAANGWSKHGAMIAAQACRYPNGRPPLIVRLNLSLTSFASYSPCSLAAPLQNATQQRWGAEHLTEFVVLARETALERRELRSRVRCDSRTSKQLVAIRLTTGEATSLTPLSRVSRCQQRTVSDQIGVVCTKRNPASTSARIRPNDPRYHRTMTLTEAVRNGTPRGASSTCTDSPTARRSWRPLSIGRPRNAAL